MTRVARRDAAVRAAEDGNMVSMVWSRRVLDFGFRRWRWRWAVVWICLVEAVEDGEDIVRKEDSVICSGSDRFQSDRFVVFWIDL
jgi:hypothetical protein